MDQHNETARACTRLVHRFCVLADSKDADGLAALFTSDATFERGDLRIKGQEGLKRMVAGRPADLKTRHLVTTSVIEEKGDREATGRHYCLVFASGADFDAAKPIVREYHDRYRLTDDGWRIASRTVFTPFAG